MKTAKHTVLILSLICVIPLLFSCASGRGISASDVRAGMSSDKLYCMLGTYGVYYGHDGDRLLFRDKNNRSVTVEFSEDMKTVAAVTSAAADPTDTDIGKITGGMTSSEVYAALGAPGRQRHLGSIFRAVCLFLRELLQDLLVKIVGGTVQRNGAVSAKPRQRPCTDIPGHKTGRIMNRKSASFAKT